MELDHVVAKMIRAWNSDAESDRRKLLLESCEERALFVSRFGVNQGIAELSGQIAEFRKANPLGRVTHGPAMHHHGFATFRWTTLFGEGKPPLEGIDFVDLNAEGKITRLVSYSPLKDLALGPLPSPSLPTRST